MRIFEIETFGRGGLAHYVYNLSSALAERGHEVTLITAAGYELEGRSLPAGVRLVKRIGRWSQGTGAGWPTFLRRSLQRLEAVADALRVALFVRRRRPDVVHLHCTNPAALAYLTLLRLAGTPVVATAHVVTPHEPIPLEGAVFRRIHRRCDRLIAHSGFDRRRLAEELAVPPSKVDVIPHGEYGFFERAREEGDREEGDRPIDRAAARRSLGLDEEAEVALFFGYIREYKGLDLLLEAWSEVAAARPRAKLVIAGDPVRLDRRRREELEARADGLGALHRFVYVPFSEVARYFRAADLLVMPYRHVSQSGVLYLALSLGVPVVTTRVGALPELLDDGDSALLVPPESPSDLARAVTRALGDPALRQRLAEGGRRIAAEHSWPAVAELTEAAFHRAVAT